MIENLTIRSATVEDACFIAKCVLAAAHLTDFEYSEKYTAQFNEICSREDSLYSYLNTRILTLDGEPAGCMVSYDGASYDEGRRVTFAFFDNEPEDIVVTTGTETFPGEWYLDSLAIKPEYRKKGFGTMLIEDAIEIARRHGSAKVTLIAEKDNETLKSYYRSFGFEVAEDITFFGDPYVRMVKSIRQSTK